MGATLVHHIEIFLRLFQLNELLLVGFTFIEAVFVDYTQLVVDSGL